MSSFKIIKGAMPAEKNVVKYSFEALPEKVEPLFSSESDEFQALFSAVSCTADTGADESDTAAPPEDAPLSESGDAPGPSEEELRRMLGESFDKGVAEGREQAGETLDNACRTLSVAIAEVGGLKERIIRESEEDLLRLAIMVAKQIVQQEISQDRKILAQFVTEATRGITDRDELVICFNPEDCRIVSANRHLYLAGIDEKRQVTIKPDDSVPAGGCVVETRTGLVDARVEAQLSEIFKRLMEERANSYDGALAMSMETEQYLPEQYGVEQYGYPKN